MSHVSQNSCRGIKKRGGFELKFLIAKADVVIKSTATYVKYLIARARDLLIFIFYFIGGISHEGGSSKWNEVA